MSVAAYLYPWDVAGDPSAPDLVAGLGLDHVVLAAHYHATRALTPRHPGHRIVVAPRSRDYGGDPSFLASVAGLRSAGVAVRAWAVVNHVDLAEAGADHVVNAFGDVYPWALCAGRAAVLDRAVTMAAEVAALDGIDGVELESCGWYGFDHLSAHDKSGGLPPSPAMEFLLSLCFCPVCEEEFRAAGLGDLRGRVRAAVDGLLRGPDRTAELTVPAGAPRAGAAPTGAPQTSTTLEDPGLASATLAGATTPPDDEWGGIADVLGRGLADEVLAVRRRVADGFRAAVVEELRRTRPDFTVDLHSSPLPHRSLAFTGVHPPTAADLVDGLVVNCWTGPEAVAATMAAGTEMTASDRGTVHTGTDPTVSDRSTLHTGTDPTAPERGAAARAGTGGPQAVHADPATSGRRVAVYASLLAVAGLGGRPDLIAQAEAARRAGADGLRLYHAGLASDDDLAAIRALTDHLRTRPA